jgi:hypothetical protein
MKLSKVLPLLKGALRHIPGINTLFPIRTGGTIESVHCYRVWLTHLKNWSYAETKLPKVVVELGPGDSLGTGLASLLTGCECIYTLDVIKYWDNNRNLRIFNELVELFKQKPDLNKFSIPSELLLESHIDNALVKERLDLIRKEILDIENPNNTFIKCHIPWNHHDVLDTASVDFVFSNAVLSNVEDIDTTYMSMNKWLKSGGLMSHYIDFRSHGIIEPWNGHWTFSDLEWKIVRGNKPFLLNRQPYSAHINLHSRYSFKVLNEYKTKLDNTLSRVQIASRFKHLTEEDLTTSDIYILSRKVLLFLLQFLIDFSEDLDLYYLL